MPPSLPIIKLHGSRDSSSIQGWEGIHEMRCSSPFTALQGPTNLVAPQSGEAQKAQVSGECMDTRFTIMVWDLPVGTL